MVISASLRCLCKFLECGEGRNKRLSLEARILLLFVLAICPCLSLGPPKNRP